MQSFVDAMGTWSALSTTGFVGDLVGFLKSVGDFAGAASALLGLVK